jgi:hypothetical protein
MFQFLVDLFTEVNDPVLSLYLPEREISHFLVVVDLMEMSDLLVEKINILPDNFIAVLAIQVIHDNIAPAG